MSGLSTHILDLMHGKPAAHVKIDLFYLEAQNGRTLLGTFYTNEDGRLEQPYQQGNGLKAGTYEYVFYIGHYFREKEVKLPEPAFLDEVAVRFGVADPSSHYHVPLLVSPFGYQVYRGS